MSPQVTHGIRPAREQALRERPTPSAEGDGSPNDARTAREQALTALRGLRSFARGVLGSDAYDRYLHHHRITGCTHPPLSEKEFWRQKYAEQGDNPSSGCC